MTIRETVGPNLGEEAVLAFAARLRGRLIRPADAEYDPARRVWNGMIDKYPALIARCADVADVQAAVAFARDHGLLPAVRGGGHNVAGHAVCDGGLVIDLSALKGIRVDPVARTARAGAGVTWGELDRATAACGLATVGGQVSTTGIAGLTLGGGLGWLSGKHGLTCDNLLAADVVTADGRLLRASADEHPDLFWALRGGGGNFGAVTAFEYRLHPVTEVLAGLLLYPADQAGAVLRAYRDFTATPLPDELMVYAFIAADPDGSGNRVPMLMAGFAGPPEAGERAVAPLRRFGDVRLDTIAPTPYVALQSAFDALWPAGRQYYWKSHLARELSDTAVDTLVDYGRRMPSPLSAVEINHHHGALARVAPTATAYAHRDARYQLTIFSAWDGPDEAERHIAYAREFSTTLQAHLPPGGFANFLAHDESEGRVRATYRENYDRLAAIKRRYDPTNLFRSNQNIRPARAPSGAGAADR